MEKNVKESKMMKKNGKESKMKMQIEEKKVILHIYAYQKSPGRSQKWAQQCSGIFPDVL